MSDFAKDIQIFAEMKSLVLLDKTARKMEKSKSHRLKKAAKDLDYCGFFLRNMFLAGKRYE